MGADRDIRAAVHEELVADPLIDADDIVIEVIDGGVSLTGTVPSQAQCAEAAAAARRVAGVTMVDTLLAVALPSGDLGDDAALAQLANQALAAPHARNCARAAEPICRDRQSSHTRAGQLMRRCPAHLSASGPLAVVTRSRARPVPLRRFVVTRWQA